MESVGNIIMYVLIALSIILFSILTVTTKKILRSATYLLFVLLTTAMLYFQLDYEFLGAVQIAVYAGGILVLFVFAIMLTQQPGKNSAPLLTHRKVVGVCSAVAAVGLSAFALFTQADYCTRVINTPLNLDMAKIGHYLLSTEKFGYLLPFEAVSVLLLACIIGALVIARRR